MAVYNRPLYNVWHDMIRRCYYVDRPEFKWYGARGIRVSKRWLQYENFEKDMLSIYKKGLSLDRINNNGNYSRKNCRWATRKEQANNTRNIDRALRYFFDGTSMTTKEWAEVLGIKRTTLDMRLRVYKWPLSRALGGRIG